MFLSIYVYMTNLAITSSQINRFLFFGFVFVYIYLEMYIKTIYLFDCISATQELHGCSNGLVYFNFIFSLMI